MTIGLLNFYSLFVTLLCNCKEATYYERPEIYNEDEMKNIPPSRECLLYTF